MTSAIQRSASVNPIPTMPRGDKSSYTAKQKRQASHIEDSYRKRGLSEGKAEERAWRTVNKQTGGGKKKSSTSRKKSGRKTTGRKRGGSRRSTRSTARTSGRRSRPSRSRSRR